LCNATSDIKQRLLASFFVTLRHCSRERRFQARFKDPSPTRASGAFPVAAGQGFGQARSMAGANSRAQWAAAVLVLGFAASLALNWPGQLSYDSVVQLHDGRLGHYNPWHPPIMSWILGLADRLRPGTGLFILFDELLVTASLLSLLWIARPMSWVGVIAAALLVAMPQFALYQGIVWKDVLFADSALAGFVALAIAGGFWRNPPWRWILLCASFLLFVLATLARQNGALAIPFAAVALLFIARREGARWPRAIAFAFGAATLIGVLTSVVGAKLAERTGGVSGVPGQWKLLQLYDLVGEAKHDASLQFRQLNSANRDLVELIRSDGTRLYTPARNDTLVGSTDLQNEFAATTPAAIAAQWNDTLLNHPGTYLAVRARVFAWLFFTPDLVQCDAYYTGIDGPPQYLHELGIEKRFRAQDKALGYYASLFVRTPVFSHLTYALLALVLILLLMRRCTSADVAIASLLACALVFTLSFFVIGIACDYRYLLFLDVAAMSGAFYCAAAWPVGRNAGE
jgi:hypothetical protein